MKAPRWLKCLSVPGAALKALPDRDDHFGVFPGGDLRRRPTAKLSGLQLRQALGEGWLVEMAGGGFTLVEDFTAINARQQGDFREPHRLIEERGVVDGAGRVSRAQVDISDSPLARWRRPDRKSGKTWLTEDEFEAGERLRADYHRSMLRERVTSDWNSYLAPAASSSARGREDAPVSAFAAQQRVQRALEAVGPGLDRVLSSVCLREQGLEIVEAEESWPRRSGKIVLKLALQSLGRHYRMAMPV